MFWGLGFRLWIEEFRVLGFGDYILPAGSFSRLLIRKTCLGLGVYGLLGFGAFRVVLYRAMLSCGVWRRSSKPYALKP